MDEKSRLNRLPSSKAIQCKALLLSSSPHFKASKAWVYQFLKKRNLIISRNSLACLEAQKEVRRDSSIMETDECELKLESEGIYHIDLLEQDISENSNSFLFNNQY